jgi:hypothetical protein
MARPTERLPVHRGITNNRSLDFRNQTPVIDSIDLLQPLAQQFLIGYPVTHGILQTAGEGGEEPRQAIQILGNGWDANDQVLERGSHWSVSFSIFGHELCFSFFPMKLVSNIADIN